MASADASSAKDWERDGSAAAPRALATESGLRLSALRLKTDCAKASGSKILFITDLHIRSGAAWSLQLPGCGKNLRWDGIAWIAEALQEAVRAAKPDILVFGGDLAVHSCWLELAGETLAKLGCGIPKFAVLGNWDKRRRRWLPHSIWNELYEKAGFQLLVNEAAVCGPFRFFGLDDYKLGFPSYRPPESSGKRLLNCVVSHNPDAVVRAMSEGDLRETDLILCGHTHGGQFRLPGLGALITSSRHWKSFEGGLYKRKDSGCRMLVSAGIGMTAAPFRFNCPPEVSLIEFV